MQNFLPGMFKMTNFDRFHREAMGVRGLLSISQLLVYFFDETTLCPLFFSAGGVNAFAGILFLVNTYHCDILKHTTSMLGLGQHRHTLLTCNGGILNRIQKV